MVDRSESRYPYAADGQIAVPADADWLDPMIALTAAATATDRIGLATGVLLLPEHNPVILAKTAASLDVVLQGRLSLGIGVGWSREEFEALDVPFERRGARTDEYIEAIRILWRDDPASFSGSFTTFENIRVNPKPVNRRIPIIVGGNSDSALRRAARTGDGWYGFNLDGVEGVEERLHRLGELCAEAGRLMADLRVAVALIDPEPADRYRLGELGVDEIVLVVEPCADPAAASDWATNLIRAWV